MTHLCVLGLEALTIIIVHTLIIFRKLLNLNGLDSQYSKRQVLLNFLKIILVIIFACIYMYDNYIPVKTCTVGSIFLCRLPISILFFDMKNSG